MKAYIKKYTLAKHSNIVNASLHENSNIIHFHQRNKWKRNIPLVLPKAAVNFGSGSVAMGTVAMTPRNGAGFCCSTLLAIILMSPRLPLVAKGIMTCDRPTPVSKTQLNQPVSHCIHKCSKIHCSQVNTMEPHY